MCVRVCVCVCIYMCVFMCVYICVCVYIYVCVCIYVCVYIYMCVCVYMCVFMCIYMCVCVCVCICVCVYICVYTAFATQYTTLLRWSFFLLQRSVHTYRTSGLTYVFRNTNGVTSTSEVRKNDIFIVGSTEVVNDPRRPALPNEFESFVKGKFPGSGVVTPDTHQLISGHKNASNNDSYCVVSSGLLQVHNPVFCIKLITRSNKSGQCAKLNEFPKVPAA